MKARKTWLFTALVSLLVLTVASCDSKGPDVSGEEGNHRDPISQTEAVEKTEPDTEPETLPHEHIYGDWSVTPATCIDDGSRTRACSCGDTEIQVIEATGHTPGAAATCTEKQFCTICEAEITPALGHTEVIDAAVAPTCTETGLSEGKHCSVCGTVLVEQQKVPVADHTAVIDAAVAPTCVKTGLTEGKHCSVCKAVIVAQMVVPVTAHTYDSAFTEPTATEDGYTKFTCSGCGDSYTETVTPSEFMVTASNRAKIGFTGEDGEELVIPAVFQDGDVWYRVTSISGYAFQECPGLASVVIPDSVTNIGYWAFYCCPALDSVDIGNGVTKIDNSAFWACRALTSVTIGNSVTHIDEYAFAGCHALTSLTIPGNVTHIGKAAFRNCEGLTSVTLGSGVECIDYDAFAACSSLTSVTIPDGVTEIGQGAFRECTGMVSVTIPDSVTTIGWGAFADCSSLTSVVIPDGVTRIDIATFENCTDLVSVTVGSGVTSIEDEAFYGCYRLAEVIDRSALGITAGSSSHGEVAYHALEVHDGDSKILVDGDYRFYSVNDTYYLIDYMGTDTDVILPADYDGNPYVIGNYAFYQENGINSVLIPDSVTAIGDKAFLECPVLISVTVGSGVASIGEEAFRGCDRMVEVINRSSLDMTAGDASQGYISYYAREVHAGDSKVVVDGDYRFYPYNDTYYLVMYTGTDTDVILPDDCNGHSYEINDYAFYDRNDITSVTISDGVTAIGEWAFYSCDALASVTFSDSVTKIGKLAFNSCRKLTTLTIPDSVSVIGESAFIGCDGLVAVIIGTGVTKIEHQAFRDCSKLIDIFYKGTKDQWNTVAKGSLWDWNMPQYTIHYNYTPNE